MGYQQDAFTESAPALCDRVGRILDETGLGKRFVANWEAVWRDNLENNCDATARGTASSSCHNYT